MIPYFSLTEIHVGSLTLPVFGPMAVLGAAVGHFLFYKELRHAINGARKEILEGLAMATISAAVLGSLPGSSLGGLAAGLLVFMGYTRFFRLPTLRAWDALLVALPFGWLFLRMGCALVHDHLGASSQSLLAVRFPDGARYDLGLLEAMFTPLWAILALGIRRVAPSSTPGIQGLRSLMLFFAMRFFVQFASDPSLEIRYAGLTKVQWFAASASMAGALLLLVVHRTKARATPV